MLFHQTIVAPATAPGEGGIGIIRLSGPDAISALDKIFTRKQNSCEMTSHRLYHGKLVDAQGSLVDDVLAVIMRSPNSYTGEDVVELHCHGGSWIMRSVLNLVLNQGVSMAAPGEFTQRAFINGRLDLAQAEAVVEVIKSRSAKACQVALGQLDGKLSKRIHTFSDSIKHALALMEAHIDFPDDEVGSLNLSSLNQNISTLSDEIACLAASFDTGRVLREGVNVLILGRPNVGKSSLMNALLGESRAIVTEIAGTTRDTLEEQLVLAGFPIRLIDAAGVRETDDPIEREGVRRAQEKAQSADLTLLVVDGSVPLEQEDELAAQICDADKTILVLNKSDQGLLPTSAALTRFETRVEVSAKHGAGLDDLQATLERHLQGSLPGDAAEDLIVNERRHCDALLQAVQALRLFRDGVALSAPYECLALELRSALDALGLITGETTPDDILNQIFSQFCIGK